MKNREKFKNLIMSGKFNCEKVKEILNKNTNCVEIGCMGCYTRFAFWLEEEAEEEEVNWSKVEVDTRVLVSDDGKEWQKRHFSWYGDGKVWTWNNCATSWSVYDDTCMVSWKYAKLAEKIVAEETGDI